MELKKHSLRKALVHAVVFSLVMLAFHSFIMVQIFSSSQLAKYPYTARQYLAGDLDRERLLDFSPLYFYVNVFAAKMLPRPESFLHGINAVSVALSAALLFLMLSSMYSIAWVGAFAFAFELSVLVYEKIFEPEPLLLLFIVAFVFLVHRKNRSAHLLAGICFALGMLTRPNVLPVCIVVLVYFMLQNETRRRRFFSMAFFIVPVLIAFGFLLIRNHSVTDRWSPMVMNPGTVFYEGNNPNSLGLSSIYPPVLNDMKRADRKDPDPAHLLYRRFARLETGRDLTPAQVNQFWSGKALAYIRDYPGRFSKLVLRKLCHIAHSYHWHDLSNAYDHARELREAHIPLTPWNM
ncbi:ArnT family glycosyltransferase, partial [Acidobacteriota bacterium]